MITTLIGVTECIFRKADATPETQYHAKTSPTTTASAKTVSINTHFYNTDSTNPTIYETTQNFMTTEASMVKQVTASSFIKTASTSSRPTISNQLTTSSSRAKEDSEKTSNHETLENTTASTMKVEIESLTTILPTNEHFTTETVEINEMDRHTKNAETLFGLAATTGVLTGLGAWLASTVSIPMSALPTTLPRFKPNIRSRRKPMKKKLILMRTIFQAKVHLNMNPKKLQKNTLKKKVKKRQKKVLLNCQVVELQQNLQQQQKSQNQSAI